MSVGILEPDSNKESFDRGHAYSLAPEARRKRAIDLEIIGGDYSRGNEIRIDSETYLKALIRIASSGRARVRSSAKEMQFFIIRGGAEGLLPDELRDIDARNNVTHWQSTDGAKGETDFDENDLLAVFDSVGTLVGSARLRRPTYVQGWISRNTAERVYNSWAGKKVFIRRSTVPGWIPYLGLGVADGFRDGSANNGHRVFVDIHKEEQTNGCIFITDPETPALDKPELRTFEPALIKKILASKGIVEENLGSKHVVLGTMHVVTIGF